MRRRHLPLVTALLAVAVLVAASCGGRADDATPVSQPAVPSGSGGTTEPAGGGTSSTSASSVARGDGSGPAGTIDAGDPEPWSAAPAVEAIGETIQGSLVTPDGRTRTYGLYVPTTLPAGEAVPLLVGLHGGTGWGRQFQRSSRFDGIAEANGFLAVFPDGVGVGPTEAMRTWNGGVCCGPAARDDVDDVTFVSMVIDQVTARYDVDPARIYAAGHSNGAVMSIRLACELADTIVAVGYQAGSMEVDDCSPSRPVSLLHLHGEADENVPPNGGKGTKGISGVDWNPAIDGVRTVAAADDCPVEPVVVADPDHPSAKIQRWSPCAAGTEVEYVLVPGANHAWMGATAGELSPSGTPFAGFDSSEAIWAFLAAHPRR